MPTIQGGTNDGYVLKGLDSSWVIARGGVAFDTDGDNVDSNNTRDHYAVWNHYGARGGGSWGVRRAFFEFDTSGISIVPSAATLKIYGFSNTTLDVIAVRSEHSATLAVGDFDALYGASTAFGNTDGSGAGTLAGVSGLTYSAEVSTWNIDYNDFALNATALADIASLGTFKVCVMGYDYDYLDIDPIGTSDKIGCFWADAGGGTVPLLDYTAGVAVTDNATFFGSNF